MTPEQQQASTWFQDLRDQICEKFEALERAAGSDASFAYTPWDRTGAAGAPWAK